MAQVTVQQILQQGYAAFAQSHPLLGYVRKAVWALLACRTAVLGGHVQRCPDGHFERVWYNSCRHRLCPQCAWLQVERWLAQQQVRLLACDHYHVIFTMPSELHDLWRANVAVMTTLLFASVRDTLLEVLGDAAYLGAKPGVIATLHTWTQTLLLHPHVHCLVSGGGLSASGDWVAVRHGFLLPVRVVRAVFRGKLLAALRQGVAQGQLQLPEGWSPQQMVNLLNKLGRTTWNVYICERYAHGVGVLTYGEGSDQPSSDMMRLPIAEFLRRYLQHVPEPGMRVVRSYGLYAPGQGEAVAVCRAQLGQAAVATPVVLDWQTACQERGDAHPERCPVCGRRLVCLGVVLPARIPPPSAISWEGVA